jgi:dihydrofolate reductase
MRQLFVFLMITPDGFADDLDRSLSWANVSDDFNAYSISQLDGVGLLLFGRTTYEGMVEFWTSPEAAEGSPAIAERMNALPKAVASRILASVEWQPTTLVRGDLAPAVAELKAAEGRDIAVFGSSTLVVALLEAGLVDELRFMVAPTLLGDGLPVFADLHARVGLTLLRTTAFASGNVLLCYRPSPTLEA